MTVHRAGAYYRAQALAMLVLTVPAVVVATLTPDGWHDYWLLPVLVGVRTVRSAFPGRDLRDAGAGAAPGARLASDEETIRATLRTAVAPMAVALVLVAAVLVALEADIEWILVAVTLSEAIEDALRGWQVRRRERAEPGTARVVELRGPWRPVVPGVWREDASAAASRA